MSGDVTRLRALPDRVIDTRSPAEKIVELQKALGAEVALVEQRILDDMDRLRSRMDEAADYPVKPGVKEEYRKLSEILTAATQRLEAIRGRS